MVTPDSVRIFQECTFRRYNHLIQCVGSVYADVCEFKPKISLVCRDLYDNEGVFLGLTSTSVHADCFTHVVRAEKASFWDRFGSFEGR